jgi:DNA-binding response OmpR family regulator
MTSVLLVEDDNQHMRLMAWVLREEGFDVATARTADAQAHASERQPAVVVFNTSEDAGTKAACIGRLRSAAPGARIIDLGAESESPAHDSGADAYLDMPVTAAELRDAIQRLASA